MARAEAHENQLAAGGCRQLFVDHHAAFRIPEIDVVPAFVRACGDEEIVIAQRVQAIPESEVRQAKNGHQPHGQPACLREA